METRITVAALTAVLLCLAAPPSALADAPDGPASPSGAIDKAQEALSAASAQSGLESVVEHQHLRVDDARDLFLDTKLDEAEASLKALLSKGLARGPHDRAEILLGRIDMARGLGERALTHLNKVEEAAVPAPMYLVFLKAQAEAMAGHHEKAIELYQAIIKVEPEARILHYTRAALPEVLVKAGRHQEAEAAYADLLRRYPELPIRHKAMYHRAQLLLGLGQDKRGAAMMHEVWWNFPWKEEGAKARLVLEAGKLVGMKVPNPSKAELLARATYLRKRKHWREAEAALQELRIEARDDGAPLGMRNDILLQLALVAYDMQDYDTALPRLEELATRAMDPRTGAGLGQDFVMQTLQRAHHRSGDSAKAEEILRKRLTRKSPGERNRLLARFYWKDGRYSESKKHQDRILRGRDRQGWDYAFLLYKAGDFKNAERLFGTLLNDKAKRGKIPHKQILYWVARARHRQNKAVGARQLYARVIDEYPRTFYAHMASSRLREMDDQVASSASTSREARIYWNGPEAEPQDDVEALFERGEITPYTTTLNLKGASRRAAAAHGDIWKALEISAFIHGIGMEWEALWELRKVSMEFRGLNSAFSKGASPSPSRPIALTRYRRWGHWVDNRRTERLGFWGLNAKTLRYPVPRVASAKAAMAAHQLKIKSRRRVLRDDLRMAMMEMGDHHFVRRSRLVRGNWSRKDPGAEETRDMWTEVFPRAYARTVTRYAEEQGLNPYLLWALMTVESGYNPDTISYADARGLLQVIPKTGNKVAAALGENNFGHYDLMHPDTSIRHGAWYFRQLINKFKGQEPLAIASYNGGPHNVQSWLKHKTDVPLDEFVEEIPFNQARRYTKRVLKYLGVFLRIYEGSEGLYLGQSLNGDILVEPRY